MVSCSETKNGACEYVFKTDIYEGINIWTLQGCGVCVCVCEYDTVGHSTF